MRAKAAASNVDTLLLLSGGIDSTACLWQRARDGLPTRTHHVMLADWEGRQIHENRATTQVLAWIQQQYPRAQITHTESGVDFRTVRRIPRNHYLWGYWAGVLMHQKSGLTTIVVPRNKDDFSDPRAGETYDRSYLTSVELMTGQQPRLIYPILSYTKADLVKMLPEDLLKRTWWCRRPNAGQPCHTCSTCKKVEPNLPR